MEGLENQTSSGSRRGGKRDGAGRPKRSSKQVELWMKARGIKAATAAEILQHMDERRLWHRLLNSDEDRVVLESVKFLTTMRDGKPMQQINVTSMNVNVTPEDIARARAIAATLRSEGLTSVDVVVGESQLGTGSGGRTKSEHMLLGCEGGQMGGDGL